MAGYFKGNIDDDVILAHSGAPEEYTWLYNPFFLSAFFFGNIWCQTPGTKWLLLI